MPLSLFQRTLRDDYLQAEFHPIDHSILVLFAAGELKRFSLTGQEIWGCALPWKPLVFRIHIDGNLVAILGEGVLAFLDLQTLQMTTVPVDKTYRVLEFYKSCVLLGGRTNTVTLMKPTGQALRSVAFDGVVEQIKTVPRGDKFVLSTKDRQLLCTDIEGTRYWTLDTYRLSGDIHVSQDGDLGLCMKQPDEVVKFSIAGTHAVAIAHDTYVKDIALSLHGRSFLLLDVANRVTMCDHDAHILWQQPCAQAIDQIRVSGNGAYFLTIDRDQVLTCSAGQPACTRPEHFLEFDAHHRASDRPCRWRVEPGSHLPHTPLRLLTVNGAGTGMGVIGQDGRVYVLDETGQQQTAVGLPAIVEAIGISDAVDAGYIYGENRMQLLNIRQQQSHYLRIPHALVSQPCVNFHQQKVYVLSAEPALWLYDFAGQVDTCIALPHPCHTAVSCDEAGIVLLHDQGLVGMSAEGRLSFTLPLEDGPTAWHAVGHWLIGLTPQPAVLSVDLASLQVHTRRIPARHHPVRIASLNPLLLTLGERLVHLHHDLSVIATYTIRSPWSAFWLHEDHLSEITASPTGLVCYDAQGNLAWRYRADAPIRDAQRTKHGMVVMTEQSLAYVAVREREGSHTHLAHFLEL